MGPCTWEEKVREFKFKVQTTWTRDKLDEISNLKKIGMHHHARLLEVLEDVVGRGDIVEARAMASSAKMQASIVKAFMRTRDYKDVMDDWNTVRC